MKKTNIKMYRSKETLEQAPLYKRKESYGPGPTERMDKTTVACCLYPEPSGLGARRVTGRGARKSVRIGL